MLLSVFLCLSLSATCERNDEQEIELAYRAIFSKEFGYTLIGLKPISEEDMQYEYLQINPEILQKFVVSLQKVFAHSRNFVLKVFPFGENSYRLELIHKKALLELVAKTPLIKPL